MSFTSPMRGRFTSGFGRRGSSFHAGIDIAPPVPGTVGTPVYAAEDGKVVRVVRGRKHGQPSSSGTTIAPGRSGNGILVAVGSGRFLYNHVRAIPSISYGDRVYAGQLIGYTDTSGIQTGPHLHFEAWSSSSSSSYYNPVTLFTRAGIAVGSTPRKSSSSGNHGFSVSSAKSVQTVLKKMGYYKGNIDGAYGPMTMDAVRAYQKKSGLYVDGIWGSKTSAYYHAHEGKVSAPKPPTGNWARSKSSATSLVKKLGYSSIPKYQAAQRCPGGLTPDGIWGKMTESHYRETKKMQDKMNDWKGDNIRVDGDYGRATAARVRDIKSRNKGGAWKGSVNTNPDSAFMRMLGVNEYHNHK